MVAAPSEVSVQPEGVVGGARHHAHPLVLAHALLKEVGLPLQRDVLHEVKGVLHPVHLHASTHTRSVQEVPPRSTGSLPPAAGPFRTASISAAATLTDDHLPSNQSSATALSPHDWLRSVPLRVSSPRRRSRGGGSGYKGIRGRRSSRRRRSPWNSPVPASVCQPQTRCSAS